MGLTVTLRHFLSAAIAGLLWNARNIHHLPQNDWEDLAQWISNRVAPQRSFGSNVIQSGVANIFSGRAGLIAKQAKYVRAREAAIRNHNNLIKAGAACPLM
jgi:hypothetical protein